jgi:PAS domain S-box-containing protein
MSPRWRYALEIAAVGAVYFAAARVGLLAAVAQPVVSSAWPPSGVALAALLLLGPRLWPGIALGAFLLNWTAGVSVAGAAGIATGNTLEAVAGAWLLTRVVDFRPSLERVRDVIALVVVGALASTTLSATLGVASLWASGAVAPDGLRRLWFVWWSGDALGDVLVAPFLLTRLRAALPAGRRLEAAGLLAALLLLTALLFRNPLPYVYAVFPVVVWAALRFGSRGTATATAVVAVLTIGYTLRGLGPFVSSTPTENLALLQTFLGLTTVTGLVLAAAVTERSAAERALHRETTFVRLLQDVAVAANGAQTVAQVLQTAVTEVCRVTGWPVGHVYMVSPGEPDLLRPTATWIDLQPEQHAPFRRVTEITTYGRGIGLPGRVLASRRPAWMLDVTTDPDSPRAEAARVSGLRAGFAFPVLVGADVMAVLEFYAREPVAPDASLLDVMGNIGTQLGRVIERERAAQALQEREALLGTMFDQSAVGIAVADRRGRFIRSNRAFQEMIGYDAAELRALSYADITYADDLAEKRELLAELARGTRSSFTFEQRYCRKDGRVIWAHVTASTLPGDDGTPERFVGMVEDVTERQAAETELHRHRAQLRGLAARLEAAREAERARIAREIHDELGQALTALKIDLLWLKKRVPASPPELRHKLDGMAAIIDSTAQGIQRVAAELRPSVLDELGLRAAIEWEAREFATRTGIECRVELPERPLALDPSRATAVFRIFQEALTNVARHAAATHVLVRLGVAPKALELTVQDNGRGIREGALHDSRSLGLLGMRERAETFQGNVKIAGNPGAGTTLTLTMPRSA